MLLTASWVLPIRSDPIRHGAVLIHGSRIAEIGPADELLARHPNEPHKEFGGCTLLPGLVNAHTHLAMTCLKGLIPSRPFHEWIARIPTAWRALGADDIAASIAMGAILSITSGVTVVGDIAYGPESLAICADTGLGGTFYWEVLGIKASELPYALHDAEFPLDPARGFDGRLQAGISPHAPYTSGPELLRATHVIASAQRAAYAIHVAESPAEEELMRSGTGPLAGVAERLALGWKTPSTSTVRYLDGLGVLENAVAIHCVNVLPSDIPLIARRTAGIVLCPRSNRYLHVGDAPAERLAASDARLALGTDSLASNSDLDLFAEARALAVSAPGLGARYTVEMMTVGGAQVLGLDEHFGSLEPGRQADLAVYRTDGDNPYEALLAEAGRSTVEAVLAAGVWRMLEGAPTFGVSTIERASHLAGQRAALALGLSETDV
ncbi:MAG: amidohydrolase family protein [Coriobacteriia bacterium]|nr:amidohydrolase family protein [Coriobacteriia bacterium]